MHANNTINNIFKNNLPNITTMKDKILSVVTTI